MGQIMINTVIFDIGRVLAGYGWEKYLRGIAPEEEAYRAVEQAVFLSPDWEEHDKGLLTEEEEIRDFISNAPKYEKEIRQTYENLGECVWKLDYALPWVQDLKSRGFRVFALSNWPKHIYDQRKDKLDFLDLMDGYILSYQEHVIKPDPAVFRLLLERYRIVKGDLRALNDSVLPLLSSLSRTAFGFTAVTDRPEEIRRAMPDALLERASIDDIMLSNIEGGKNYAAFAD